MAGGRAARPVAFGKARLARESVGPRVADALPLQLDVRHYLANLDVLESDRLRNHLRH